MNIIENWKNLIENVKAMSQKDIDGWKYLIIFLIVADMFGVFWYLKLKTLALALMLVLMGLLAFLLIIGGKDLPLPTHNKIKKEVKPKMDETAAVEEETQEPQSEGLFDMDIGIDTEDLQKRMDKSLGESLF